MLPILAARRGEFPIEHTTFFYWYKGKTLRATNKEILEDFNLR